MICLLKQGGVTLLDLPSTPFRVIIIYTVLKKTCLFKTDVKWEFLDQKVSIYISGHFVIVMT